MLFVQWVLFKMQSSRPFDSEPIMGPRSGCVNTVSWLFVHPCFRTGGPAFSGVVWRFDSSIARHFPAFSGIFRRFPALSGVFSGTFRRFFRHLPAFSGTFRGEGGAGRKFLPNQLQSRFAATIDQPHDAPPSIGLEVGAWAEPLKLLFGIIFSNSNFTTAMQ